VHNLLTKMKLKLTLYTCAMEWYLQMGQSLCCGRIKFSVHEYLFHDTGQMNKFTTLNSIWSYLCVREEEDSMVVSLCRLSQNNFLVFSPLK
jgi:hypothetical protein